MLIPSWQSSLQAILQPLKNEPDQRTAVLGVGSELRGDDAAGPIAVRALQEHLPTHDNLLLLDTGPSPEAYTGRLRSFQPDWVLFIDAAQLDSEPGTIAWLGDDEITGLSASTHTLPVSVMTRYLTAEFGCKIALIGIQPAYTTLEAPLSAPVAQAVQSLVEVFIQMIQPGRTV